VVDTGRVIQRCARLGLLVIAAGLFIAAAVTPPSHVTAVRVSATAQSTLASRDCSAGKVLLVSFLWHGVTVTESDDSPSCGHDVVTGVPLTLYVASNDQTNVGPNANWILNPDTHDPFDFIGPNGLRSFIVTLGALPLIGALIWYLVSYQARRRSQRFAAT
jgi:hypothetical protein